MKTFKRLTIFLLANLLLACSLQFVLTEPSLQQLRFREFQQDNYSTVVVGHSLGQYGVDPHYLTSDPDDKAFNMGQGLLQFDGIYYYLRQMNQTSDLKRVYLDLYYDYWMTDFQQTYGGIEPKQMLGVLSGWTELQYILDVMTGENYNDFFFRYDLSAEAIRSIPETIRTKLLPGYRTGDPALIDKLLGSEEIKYIGRFYSVLQHEDYPYPYHNFDEGNLNPDTVRSFDRIVEFCKDEGIELICFTSALPPARLQKENHDAVHTYYQQLCDSRGVPFFDMNYLKFELFPRTADDYKDVDGHLMGNMAIRQAELLRDITASDHREQFFEKNYEAVLAGIQEYEEKAS